MSESGDTLAAEFVLGTLDGLERAQARVLLGTDAAFAANVRIWERRLNELHLMVEPMEPDAQLWERIKSKLPARARKSAAGSPRSTARRRPRPPRRRSNRAAADDSNPLPRRLRSPPRRHVTSAGAATIPPAAPVPAPEVAAPVTTLPPAPEVPARRGSTTRRASG